MNLNLGTDFRLSDLNNKLSRVQWACTATIVIIAIAVY